ncbi:MAG: hypothetical protein JW966_13505 [Anaerolineae bacterium]|nr:hypothetical protein [Anaerolineae bacterium]
MQQRRWRWLWIWVSVLVAGCGQIWSSDGTPPPPRETRLPLFDYTLLPPSLTPSVWPAHTATPLMAVDSGSAALSPVAIYLAVSGPACYETPVGSLICLGQVRNMLDRPVEHVMVSVQLLARDGTPLASSQTLIAQIVLPAGRNAPYRVLFDEVPENYAGAYAFVESGQIAENAGDRYADLGLRQVGVVFLDEQYQVTLSISNKSARTAEQLSIVVTLLDDAGHVTGFRQMVLSPDRHLEPGETLALMVEVIPQGLNTVAFEAYAEGVLSTN